MRSAGVTESPRFSHDRADLIRIGTEDDDDDNNDIGVVRGQLHCRRSFSYHRLPEPLIELSVLKLDGSCFDVHVRRMASVSELKQVIEEVFSQASKDADGGISWSHVWGHFCLCYEGQKLVNDKDYLRAFGIKDGDQLHFIRYLSINYNPTKKSAKYQREASNRSHTMLLKASDIHGKNGENGEDSNQDDNFSEKYRHPHQHNSNYDKLDTIGEDSNEDDNFSEKYGDPHQHNSDHDKLDANVEDSNEDDMVEHIEFKVAHLFRRWLLCSRSRRMRRTMSMGKLRHSRLGDYLKVGT